MYYDDLRAVAADLVAVVVLGHARVRDQPHDELGRRDGEQPGQQPPRRAGDRLAELLSVRGTFPTRQGPAGLASRVGLTAKRAGYAASRS